MVDLLTETNPKDVLARVEGSDLSTWSETKRDAFCLTFKHRVLAAKYILVLTASIIFKSAKRRQFISDKHDKAIFKGFPHSDRYGDPFGPFYEFDLSPDRQHHNMSVGGRDPDALVPIADQRAKEILKNLPPLAQAVEIIDVETARKIDRKDKLLEKGEALKEQLEAACGTIDMADLDQEMSIGAFRKMVKERNDHRKRLIEQMNGIAEEGRKLEEQIARKLYAGLPGLSEAVIEVIRNHLEQALALDSTARRVEEQVKFGDSEAAVELLRHFEKDEVQISDRVKEQFQQALEKLKLSVKKGRKAPKELRA